MTNHRGGGHERLSPDQILSSARAMRAPETKVLASSTRRLLLGRWWSDPLGKWDKWADAESAAFAAAERNDLVASLDDCGDEAFLVTAEAICDQETETGRRELSEARSLIQACRGPEDRRPSPDAFHASVSSALGRRASVRLTYAAMGVGSACLAAVTWDCVESSGPYTSGHRALLLRPWRQAFGG